MTNNFDLNIAANLTDLGEYCGRCGKKLVMLDRFDNNWFSSCKNKTCASLCRCLAELKHTKINSSTEVSILSCLVHWKCQCRTGKLCEHHMVKPELVVIRCGGRDKAWASASGFDWLDEQAKQMITSYEIQRQEAFNHCGSCWSVFKVIKDKQGKKSNNCPRGCVCHCTDSQLCAVHFNCNCLNSRICEFHEKQRPDIAKALYNALPPNDPIRQFIGNSFARAEFEFSRVKTRRRKQKKIKITPVVSTSVNQLAITKLTDFELSPKLAAFDGSSINKAVAPETVVTVGFDILQHYEVKAESDFELESEPAKFETPATIVSVDEQNDSKKQTTSKHYFVKQSSKKSIKKQVLQKVEAVDLSKIQPVSKPATKSQSESKPELVKSKDAAKFDLASEIEAKLPMYRKWLNKQLLSTDSCSNYISQIGVFIEFLKESK